MEEKLKLLDKYAKSLGCTLYKLQFAFIDNGKKYIYDTNILNQETNPNRIELSELRKAEYIKLCAENTKRFNEICLQHGFDVLPCGTICEKIR